MVHTMAKGKRMIVLAPTEAFAMFLTLPLILQVGEKREHQMLKLSLLSSSSTFQ